MSGKREKKRKKTKTSSDDILESLFEDIKTAGPVEDIAGLLEKEQKHKDEKKTEKEKKVKKSKKEKSKKSADESKSKKHKRSKRSQSRDSRKHSPPNKRKRSRSPSRRRSSPSPERRTRKRNQTPPMYRKSWESYKSKFEWGKTRTRGRDGLLPWEKDRWSRSPSWSPTRYVRRNRSKSPRPREIDENRIDKAELLRIARRNVSRLTIEGRLPKGMDMGSTLKNKSIKELIDFCYEIQKRDFEVPVPESFVPTTANEDDNDSADFTSFPVRSSIRIRIKDGVEKTARSKLERLIEQNALRDHFPISSGEKHKGDKDWMAVESAESVGGIVHTLSKKTIKVPTAYTAYQLKDEFKSTVSTTQSTFDGTTSGVDEESNVPILLPPPSPPQIPPFNGYPTSFKVSEPAPLTIVSNEEFMLQSEESIIAEVVETLLWQVTMQMERPIPEKPKDLASFMSAKPMEFKLPEGAVLSKPVAPLSIGGLVSRRARLVKELNLDKENHQLRLEISDIDLKLSLWAKTTSETSAHFGASAVMTQEIEPRPVANSIWATKDTLRNAPELKGGIGAHLLQRMGWRPGQGLGRDLNGPVMPLILDIKADRKGLQSQRDKAAPRREQAANLNGRNPITVIMEYCAKQKYPPPLFAPIEDGPPNQRRFGCKAVLNGIEYDAATASSNKKAAKAQVCFIMCQALGLQ
ncbi:G-patch domain-containing protein [Aphelenchoides besseyi]|nr:G-patch domain-containing protein [Aphelenchoides besseyi]